MHVLQIYKLYYYCIKVRGCQSTNGLNKKKWRVKSPINILRITIFIAITLNQIVYNDVVYFFISVSTSCFSSCTFTANCKSLESNNSISCNTFKSYRSEQNHGSMNSCLHCLCTHCSMMLLDLFSEIASIGNSII